MMIRPMEPAGNGLEKILRRTLRGLPETDAPVVAWPLACGHRVSLRTRALNCCEGILRIQVPDARWRSEMQSMASQYLAILNRYATGSVKRIEFVVAGEVR